MFQRTEEEIRQLGRSGLVDDIDDIDDLIHKVDEYLYKAKEQRNFVFGHNTVNSACKGLP